MLCLLWCLFVLLGLLMFGWRFGVSLPDCCWIWFWRLCCWQVMPCFLVWFVCFRFVVFVGDCLWLLFFCGFWVLGCDFGSGVIAVPIWLSLFRFGCCFSIAWCFRFCVLIVFVF